MERKTDIMAAGQFAFYPVANQSCLKGEHFEDPERHRTHTCTAHITRVHTMASHKDTDSLDGQSKKDGKQKY